MTGRGSRAVSGSDDEELEQLAERMGELIRRGMGARSRWALRAALDAAEVDGVAGLVTLNVPARKARCDVSFTIGTVEVVQRWEAS